MSLLYIIQDGESQTPPVYRRAPPRFPRLLVRGEKYRCHERGRYLFLLFFFFVSSADSAITTLISSCRQVRLGRRTEEETSGIPGYRKPLGVRHSLRDGLRIPRVPLFDSIASYPSALARSHSRHAYLPLLISSLSISFLVNLSRVSLRLIATPLFLPPTKLLNDFVG